MNKYFFSIAFVAACTITTQAQINLNVQVTNNSKIAKKVQPIVLSLKNYQGDIRSAIVTDNGEEIPCQLDDLDGDDIYDELCFITDIDKRAQKTFNVSLYKTGSLRTYPAKVFAEMLIYNKNVKVKNQQNLFIHSMTAEKGTNPYSAVHHHGPAFENELVAYRIYFDHRQTVDLYGKFKKQLELRETQFYPDEQQKAAGYGDDVLWAGQSVGLGALRGYDGKQQCMLEDVDYRTMTVIAKGPLRTIVAVTDKGWNTGNPGKDKITMTTRYILYAGRRDCQVDINFNRSASGYQFLTGLVNIKKSQEFSDKKGLRGCWGADWTVSGKDTLTHKKETVGLGICIPQDYITEEKVADSDNYPYIISTNNNHIGYYITFGSDNETFGYHNAKDWFEYLKNWKDDLSSPLNISTTIVNK